MRGGDSGLECHRRRWRRALLRAGYLGLFHDADQLIQAVEEALLVVAGAPSAAVVHREVVRHGPGLSEVD